MPERDEHEARLFVRYEARIVTLELDVEALQEKCDRYFPVVDMLREANLVADALALRLRDAATFRLSKVHMAVGLLALFVPSLVSAVVTALLVKGHL